MADALNSKEDSPLFEAAVNEEEASSSTLSGTEWRVWDKIWEATRLDARALEIIELLEAQGQDVVGYSV